MGKDTTWRKLLEPLLEKNGDSFEGLIVNTEVEGGMDKEFNNGFGAAEGPLWVAWSCHWVYIAAEYDGSEDIIAVPRNARPGIVWHHELNEVVDLEE